jgi:hypothetical protein
MTDPYGPDEGGAPDRDLEIGDPYQDSTWNTLTGMADAGDVLDEDDFENFLMEPDRDPEGILADTVEQVAPSAGRLDVDATTDRTFAPDEQVSGLDSAAG